MKPGISYPNVLQLLQDNKLQMANEKVALVGIRGYFRDTMGAKGKNDIGIWDDALIWVDQTQCTAFNGNTDPSRHYNNVATLRAGIWTYKIGLHGFGRATPPYYAFRQAEPVTVDRYIDGVHSKEDTGNFAINIHRGGPSTTSSAGCQTVPPAQWMAFKEYGYMLLARHKKPTFKYLLVENDGSIA